MKSLLCLVVLGLFFAYTSAKTLVLQDSESDKYVDEEEFWTNIEKELEESPFIEIDSGLSENGLTSDNPNYEYCKCRGDDECGCCAGRRIFKEQLNGCVDFIYYNSEKGLNVSVEVNNARPLSHVFYLGFLETVCVPIPYLSKFLNVCLKTDTFEDVEEGLRVCTSAELRVIRATALKVNFNCINLKDGKFGFADGQTSGKSLINISVKNPLKAIIEFIKKHRRHH